MRIKKMDCRLFFIIEKNFFKADVICNKKSTQFVTKKLAQFFAILPVEGATAPAHRLCQMTAISDIGS